MSLLDSFFNKGFKAAKCKTLLKLTIPRIKLLRNRRELQIKQMRRDIANLLETGQDATARIRVEHIIREENMMAAQEIIELFCELISARLPIIEAQRECPLDLKEAISSVCFAAPRCADLPELLQVQMSFASKYGREFIAAATELMPDCGVNRQLIELLSVRAPSAEKKMKLLKEIAEEHEIDWDPAASETELFKSHEDLLNGPPQFVTGSKVPLPEEKHDESLQAASRIGPDEVADSYTGFDPLEFPEVPKVIVKPSVETNPTLESAVPLPPIPSAPSPESDEVMKYAGNNEYLTHQPPLEPEHISQAGRNESPRSSGSANQNKQFVPFISPPSLPAMSFPSGESSSQSPIPLKSKNDPRVDFQDVLAAAQTAAESAERAASAARTAASLAQVRISELTDRKNENESHERSNENPFYLEESSISVSEKPCFEQRNSSGDYEKTNRLSTPEREDDHVLNESNFPNNRSKFPGSEMESKYSPANEVFKEESTHHQPQRASSMDDDSYFSYPNLFTSQKKQTQGNSVRGNSHSTDATS